MSNIKPLDISFDQVDAQMSPLGSPTPARENLFDAHLSQIFDFKNVNRGRPPRGSTVYRILRTCRNLTDRFQSDLEQHARFRHAIECYLNGSVHLADSIISTELIPVDSLAFLFEHREDQPRYIFRNNLTEYLLSRRIDDINLYSDAQSSEIRSKLRNYLDTRNFEKFTEVVFEGIENDTKNHDVWCSLRQDYFICTHYYAVEAGEQLESIKETYAKNIEELTRTIDDKAKDGIPDAYEQLVMSIEDGFSNTIRALRQIESERNNTLCGVYTDRHNPEARFILHDPIAIPQVKRSATQFQGRSNSFLTESLAANMSSSSTASDELPLPPPSYTSSISGAHQQQSSTVFTPVVPITYQCWGSLLRQLTGRDLSQAIFDAFDKVNQSTETLHVLFTLASPEIIKTLCTFISSILSILREDSRDEQVRPLFDILFQALREYKHEIQMQTSFALQRSISRLYGISKVSTFMLPSVDSSQTGEGEEQPPATSSIPLAAILVGADTITLDTFQHCVDLITDCIASLLRLYNWPLLEQMILDFVQDQLHAPEQDCLQQKAIVKALTQHDEQQHQTRQQQREQSTSGNEIPPLSSHFHIVRTETASQPAVDESGQEMSTDQATEATTQHICIDNYSTRMLCLKALENIVTHYPISEITTSPIYQYVMHQHWNYFAMYHYPHEQDRFYIVHHYKRPAASPAMAGSSARRTVRKKPLHNSTEFDLDTSRELKQTLCSTLSRVFVKMYQLNPLPFLSTIFTQRMMKNNNNLMFYNAIPMLYHLLPEDLVKDIPDITQEWAQYYSDAMEAGTQTSLDVTYDYLKNDLPPLFQTTITSDVFITQFARHRHQNKKQQGSGHSNSFVAINPFLQSANPGENHHILNDDPNIHNPLYLGDILPFPYDHLHNLVNAMTIVPLEASLYTAKLQEVLQASDTSAGGDHADDDMLLISYFQEPIPNDVATPRKYQHDQFRILAHLIKKQEYIQQLTKAATPSTTKPSSLMAKLSPTQAQYLINIHTMETLAELGAFFQHSYKFAGAVKSCPERYHNCPLVFQQHYAMLYQMWLYFDMLLTKYEESCADMKEELIKQLFYPKEAESPVPEEPLTPTRAQQNEQGGAAAQSQYLGISPILTQDPEIQDIQDMNQQTTTGDNFDPVDVMGPEWHDNSVDNTPLTPPVSVPIVEPPTHQDVRQHAQQPSVPEMSSAPLSERSIDFDFPTPEVECEDDYDQSNEPESPRDSSSPRHSHDTPTPNDSVDHDDLDRVLSELITQATPSRPKKDVSTFLINESSVEFNRSRRRSSASHIAADMPPLTSSDDLATDMLHNDDDDEYLRAIDAQRKSLDTYFKEKQAERNQRRLSNASLHSTLGNEQSKHAEISIASHPSTPQSVSRSLSRLSFDPLKPGVSTPSSLQPKYHRPLTLVAQQPPESIPFSLDASTTTPTSIPSVADIRASEERDMERVNRANGAKIITKTVQTTQTDPLVVYSANKLAQQMQKEVHAWVLDSRFIPDLASKPQSFLPPLPYTFLLLQEFFKHLTQKVLQEVNYHQAQSYKSRGKPVPGNLPRLTLADVDDEQLSMLFEKYAYNNTTSLYRVIVEGKNAKGKPVEQCVPCKYATASTRDAIIERHLQRQQRQSSTLLQNYEKMLAYFENQLELSTLKHIHTSLLSRNYREVIYFMRDYTPPSKDDGKGDSDPSRGPKQPQQSSETNSQKSSEPPAAAAAVVSSEVKSVTSSTPSRPRTPTRFRFTPKRQVQPEIKSTPVTPNTKKETIQKSNNVSFAPAPEKSTKTTPPKQSPQKQKRSPVKRRSSPMKSTSTQTAISALASAAFNYSPITTLAQFQKLKPPSPEGPPHTVDVRQTPLKSNYSRQLISKLSLPTAPIPTGMEEDMAMGRNRRAAAPRFSYQYPSTASSSAPHTAVAAAYQPSPAHSTAESFSTDCFSPILKPSHSSCGLINTPAQPTTQGRSSIPPFSLNHDQDQEEVLRASISTEASLSGSDSSTRPRRKKSYFTFDNDQENDQHEEPSPPDSPALHPSYSKHSTSTSHSTHSNALDVTLSVQNVSNYSELYPEENYDAEEHHDTYTFDHLPELRIQPSHIETDIIPITTPPAYTFNGQPGAYRGQSAVSDTSDTLSNQSATFFTNVLLNTSNFPWEDSEDSISASSVASLPSVSTGEMVPAGSANALVSVDDLGQNHYQRRTSLVETIPEIDLNDDELPSVSLESSTVSTHSHSAPNSPMAMPSLSVSRQEVETPVDAEMVDHHTPLSKHDNRVVSATEVESEAQPQFINLPKLDFLDGTSDNALTLMFPQSPTMSCMNGHGSAVENGNEGEKRQQPPDDLPLLDDHGDENNTCDDHPCEENVDISTFEEVSDHRPSHFGKQSVQRPLHRRGFSSTDIPTPISASPLHTHGPPTESASASTSPTQAAERTPHHARSSSVSPTLFTASLSSHTSDTSSSSSNGVVSTTPGQRVVYIRRPQSSGHDDSHSQATLEEEAENLAKLVKQVNVLTAFTTTDSKAAHADMDSSSDEFPAAAMESLFNSPSSMTSHLSGPHPQFNGASSQGFFFQSTTTSITVMNAQVQMEPHSFVQRSSPRSQLLMHQQHQNDENKADDFLFSSSRPSQDKASPRQMKEGGGDHTPSHSAKAFKAISPSRQNLKAGGDSATQSSSPFKKSQGSPLRQQSLPLLSDFAQPNEHPPTLTIGGNCASQAPSACDDISPVSKASLSSCATFSPQVHHLQVDTSLSPAKSKMTDLTRLPTMKMSHADQVRVHSTILNIDICRMRESTCHQAHAGNSSSALVEIEEISDSDTSLSPHQQQHSTEGDTTNDSEESVSHHQYSEVIEHVEETDVSGFYYVDCGNESVDVDFNASHFERLHQDVFDTTQISGITPMPITEPPHTNTNTNESLLVPRFFANEDSFVQESQSDLDFGRETLPLITDNEIESHTPRVANRQFTFDVSAPLPVAVAAVPEGTPTAVADTAEQESVDPHALQPTISQSSLSTSPSTSSSSSPSSESEPLSQPSLTHTLSPVPEEGSSEPCRTHSALGASSFANEGYTRLTPEDEQLLLEAFPALFDNGDDEKHPIVYMAYLTEPEAFSYQPPVIPSMSLFDAIQNTFSHRMVRSLTMVQTEQEREEILKLSAVYHQKLTQDLQQSQGDQTSSQSSTIDTNGLFTPAFQRTKSLFVSKISPSPPPPSSPAEEPAAEQEPPRTAPIPLTFRSPFKPLSDADPASLMTPALRPSAQQQRQTMQQNSGMAILSSAQQPSTQPSQNDDSILSTPRHPPSSMAKPSYSNSPDLPNLPPASVEPTSPLRTELDSMDSEEPYEEDIFDIIIPDPPSPVQPSTLDHGLRGYVQLTEPPQYQERCELNSAYGPFFNLEVPPQPQPQPQQQQPSPSISHGGSEGEDQTPFVKNPQRVSPQLQTSPFVPAQPSSPQSPTVDIMINLNTPSHTNPVFHTTGIQIYSSPLSQTAVRKVAQPVASPQPSSPVTTALPSPQMSHSPTSPISPEPQQQGSPSRQPIDVSNAQQHESPSVALLHQVVDLLKANQLSPSPNTGAPASPAPQQPPTPHLGLQTMADLLEESKSQHLSPVQDHEDDLPSTSPDAEQSRPSLLSMLIMLGKWTGYSLAALTTVFALCILAGVVLDNTDTLDTSLQLHETHSTAQQSAEWQTRMPFDSHDEPSSQVFEEIVLNVDTFVPLDDILFDYHHDHDNNAPIVDMTADTNHEETDSIAQVSSAPLEQQSVANGSDTQNDLNTNLGQNRKDVVDIDETPVDHATPIPATPAPAHPSRGVPLPPPSSLSSVLNTPSNRILVIVALVAGCGIIAAIVLNTTTAVLAPPINNDPSVLYKAHQKPIGMTDHKTFTHSPVIPPSSVHSSAGRPMSALRRPSSVLPSITPLRYGSSFETPDHRRSRIGATHGLASHRDNHDDLASTVHEPMPMSSLQRSSRYQPSSRPSRSTRQRAAEPEPMDDLASPEPAAARTTRSGRRYSRL